MRTALVVATILAGAARAMAADAAPGGLEPYQMVRSLQLVQDRIADGDHAALPMQRKLLELIDARLRAAKPATFEDERNARALLIYAMSGGNPTTVRAVMPRLDPAAAESALGNGIASYVKGDFAAARDRLAGIEPLDLSPEVGAFAALVKGTVLTPENPETALDMLDEARLLAPGTLVEEAALRRTIALSAKLDAPDRFLRASSQYVRRFLRSPYASQFAEAFVAAIVALRETVDLASVEAVVDDMSDEQAHVVYLRLARQSAIDGHETLLDFASSRAARFAEPNAEEDPRALLYSSISSVTSDNVEEVLNRLGEIDRSRLSTNDRKLLDAAHAVAREVMAGLDRHDETATGKNVSDDAPNDAGEVVADARAAPGGPATRDSAPVPDDEGTAKAPAPEAGEALGKPAEALPATEDILASARGKLDAVDRLLEESVQ